MAADVGLTARTGGRRQAPERTAAVAVAVGIALLPLLTPGGPGNTGPIDLVLSAAVLVSWLALVGAGKPLRLPYAVPVAVLVTGAAVGSLVSGRSYSAVLAILQELFLLCWAGAVCAGASRPEDQRFVLRAWAVTASLWSAALVLGSFLGISVLTGTGERATLTFGDPNRAGVYFATSWFVLRAAQYPRTPWRRYGCELLLLYALALTGSNAALVAIALGSLLVWLWTSLQRNPVATVIGASAAVLLGVLVVTQLPIKEMSQRAAQGGTVLARSIGRSDKTGEDRAVLVTETLALYRTDSGLLGVGPGGTKRVLAANQAPYVKEAHNDYSGTLVERGLIGGIGLLLLFGAVGTRCRDMLGRASRRAALPETRPELLAAGAAGLALAGGFHEVLHFRDLWALLGLIAALALPQTTHAREDTPCTPS